MTIRFSMRLPLACPRRWSRSSAVNEDFRKFKFILSRWTVHLDGRVEVEAAYYSAPPGWISRRVQVQWDTHHVRLLNPHMGELLLRAPAARARRTSHQRRRPSQADAAVDPTTGAPGRSGWSSHWRNPGNHVQERSRLIREQLFDALRPAAGTSRPI